MGVILQSWYRQNADTTVPAPVDSDTPDIAWWYDHIASQLETFKKSGFTAVLLPPVLKTNAGAFPGADGYGPYDDHDIGSKNQFFSIPTRYGSKEQLQRFVAVAHAAGMDVYVDTVPHQRMGGKNGVYDYLGSDGVTKNGRFPKTVSCFVGTPPRVPRDIIAGPVSDDFAFGDEISYYNSTPAGYMLEGMVEAGDWLTKTLDVQGYRIDDCKGISASFVNDWTNAASMAGKICIGEYYDGNPSTENWYIWNETFGRMYLFDFTTHFMVMNMCNNTSNWGMWQLEQETLTRDSPLKAVTFVENPDTDTDGFATVIWNKAQGYFWIMTTEGYPCVYYKDWSTDAGCYGSGLQASINNYIWIHENLANGFTQFRFTDYQAAVYERTGQPGLLCGINNDEYNGWRHLIGIQTNFGANVHLHDYTGHAEDVWTNTKGQVDLYLPPNVNGLGTVAFAPYGISNPFNITGHATTQMFFGDIDLDIPPLVLATPLAVRVWCAAASPIAYTLIVAPLVVATVQITDPAGVVIAVETEISGWHNLTMTVTSLPVGTTGAAFELQVTYTSTQALET